MEALGQETSLFKNIFPEYEDFADWYTSLPLSDGEEDVPSERTFSLIAYEYNDSHVRFSDESFRQHFALDIYTFYKEFEATTQAIDNLMGLDEDDISIEDSIITNMADVPEVISSTDAEQVDYVSTQNKTINKKGKLRITKELLSNKRAYTTRTFLKRFSHLFIRVFSPYYNFVVEDDE